MMLRFRRGGFLLISHSLGFFFATTRQSKESFSLHGFAIYLWSKSQLMEASTSLSFNLKHFMINSMKKVIEGKTNDPFIVLEEHFFVAFMLYKKIMRCNLKTSYIRYLISFSNRKVSDKSFMHNKVYHINFIIIIFLL
jgi:hypothetical protein